MNITEVASPKYSKADNTQIDCIITCERGILPFTARADDPEAYGAQLFYDLIAGHHGTISPYQAP